MSVADIRTQGLDKFYTIPEYAERCIQITYRELSKHNIEFDSIIEPSAGNGSFLVHLLKNTHVPVVGLDISPEHPDILEQDYLQYIPPISAKTPLVIGNPPFGKISSFAVKFFNHSSEFAHCIAFIVPRTFRRPSIQNRLCANFHLIYDEDTPTKPCQFLPAMSVKCCFQIWVKKEYKRELIVSPKNHADWEFLAYGPNDANGQPTPPDSSDFAIRAYGGKIGHIVSDPQNMCELRPKSWHWIRATIIDKDTLISRFNSIDYSISENTARQNSIGRGELVALYISQFGDINAVSK